MLRAPGDARAARRTSAQARRAPPCPAAGTRPPGLGARAGWSSRRAGGGSAAPVPQASRRACGGPGRPVSAECSALKVAGWGCFGPCRVAASSPSGPWTPRGLSVGGRTGSPATTPDLFLSAAVYSALQARRASCSRVVCVAQREGAPATSVRVPPPAAGRACTPASWRRGASLGPFGKVQARRRGLQRASSSRSAEWQPPLCIERAQQLVCVRKTLYLAGYLVHVRMFQNSN